MQTIGCRLKKERERLRMTQSELAEFGGVVRNAQANYEKDARSPDAKYLEGIAKAGIDVLYVLTGQHVATSNPRSSEMQGGLDRHDVLPSSLVASLSHSEIENARDYYIKKIDEMCKKHTLYLSGSLSFKFANLIIHGVLIEQDVEGLIEWVDSIRKGYGYLIESYTKDQTDQLKNELDQKKIDLAEAKAALTQAEIALAKYQAELAALKKQKAK